MLFIVFSCTRARALAHRHERDKDKKHVLRAELKVCNAPYRSNRTLVANNRFALLHHDEATEHANVATSYASNTHTHVLTIRTPEKLILHTIFLCEVDEKELLPFVDSNFRCFNFSDEADTHTNSCRCVHFCGPKFLLKSTTVSDAGT